MGGGAHLSGSQERSGSSIPGEGRRGVERAWPLATRDVAEPPPRTPGPPPAGGRGGSTP